MGQAPTNALAVDYTYRKQKKERQKYHTLHSHSERTINRRQTPFIKQSLPRALSVDYARENSPDSQSDHLEPLQLRQFVGILSNENPQTMSNNKHDTDSLIDDAKGSHFEEDVDGFHLSGDYDEFPMEIDMESLKMLLIKRLQIDNSSTGDEEAESDEEEEEYDCLIHAENKYTQTANYHQATQSLEMIMSKDGAFKSISEMMFGQHIILEPDAPDIDEMDEHIMNKQEDGGDIEDELHLELKSQSETTIGTETTDTFSSIHTSQSLSHSKNDSISHDIAYLDISEHHSRFIAHGGNVKNIKIRI